MRRRLRLFFVGLVGAFLFIGVCLLVLPWVVNVDKYRPQIVNQLNDKITGRLEMGKLRLSLWGQVRIGVDGVKLSDLQGRRILSVQDAYFHVPFVSLFSGEPQFTFKMQKPALEIIKDKEGKINLLSLLKSSELKPSDEKGGAPSSTSLGTAGAGMIALPSIAMKARLGVEFHNSSLDYHDEKEGLHSQIKDLNMLLKDVSLTRPMDIKIFAELDTQIGKNALFKGPVRISGKLQPLFSQLQLEGASVDVAADFNDTEIKWLGFFEKKRSLPTHATLKVELTSNEIKIQQADLQLFNTQVEIQGRAENLRVSPMIQLSVHASPIVLDPWPMLITPLKDFELGGNLHLDAEFKGPLEQLTYQAKLKVDGVKLKYASLKNPLRFDGSIQLGVDQIESLQLGLKAPENDLQIKGKLLSFSKPLIDLQVTSTGMNLDQLFFFSKSTVKTPSEAKTPPPTTPSNLPSSDRDALLNPLRDSDMAKSATAEVRFSLAGVKIQNVAISDLKGRLVLKAMQAMLEKASFRIFGGEIKTGITVQLLPIMPTYQFDFQALGMNLSEAIASQMALFKNTLSGKANFELKGEGASFNAEISQSKLKARGMMKVEQAKFATLDVGRMFTESVNKAIDKVGDKFPQARDKKLNLENREMRYDFIASDFSISEGKLSMPSFIGKADVNQGIDLKGNCSIGLKDDALSAHFEVIDTYNLSKARDIAVEQSGIRIERVFAESGQSVRFPITLRGTLMSPVVQYTEVPEYLAKVAFDNIARGVAGRASEEFRRKAESAVKKAAPDIQKGLESFTKKLFR